MEKCAILLMHIALLGSAAAQNDGEIRLLGGAVAGEGRVEIYHNGEWGTVCDDRWDINDAAVVCRQLGYREALGAPGSAYFGRGNTTQTIWLDEVACSGSEQRLSDCQFDGWFNHDCTHSEDAGVRCANLVSQGDVRLSGGSNSREGRVEVYSSGQWGTVCSDSFWSDTDARVVCRQLGFESGTTSYEDYGSTQGVPVRFTYVICHGQEDKLIECYYNAESIFCTANTPAGVKCYGGLYGDEGNIRLAGGSYSYEGRVEIYYNNEWGTVCNNDWDASNAEVVCRQLGFSYVVDDDYYVASGGGPIHLDDVNCIGYEDSLADCFHGTWGENDCTHSQDVGVKCSATAPSGSSGLETWLIAIIVVIALVIIVTLVAIIIAVCVSAKKKTSGAQNTVAAFTVSGGNYPSAAETPVQGSAGYPTQPAPATFYPPPPNYPAVMGPVSSTRPNGSEDVPMMHYTVTNPTEVAPPVGSVVTGLPAQPQNTVIDHSGKEKPTI